jgi:hypothetical protein
MPMAGPAGRGSAEAMPAGTYVLSFVSGRYEGTRRVLRPGAELIVGRARDLDLPLVEDKVSRRHARIVNEAGIVIVEDLGSTNGTFVNGERITTVELKVGDRLLIGTSVATFQPATGVDLEGDLDADAPSPPVATQEFYGEPPPPPAPAPVPTPPPAVMQPLPAVVQPPPAPPEPPREATPPEPRRDRPAAPGRAASVSGYIEEVPLPDLLQLLSAGQKTGVLRVQGPREARIYLRRGQIKYCEVIGSDAIDPLKVLYRVMNWTQGRFDLQSGEFERVIPREIEVPTQELIMESARLADELGGIDGELPPIDADLMIALPLEAPLRGLTPEQLDAFQLVYNHSKVEGVLDMSPMSDVETYRHLVQLIAGGYVRIA